MALRVERVLAKRTIELSSLGDVNSEFLFPELRNFTSQVAVEEHRAQVRLSPPNHANAVVMDRRRVVPITEAESERLAGLGPYNTISGFKHTIRFTYATSADIYQGVVDAYTALLAAIPHRYGHSRLSLYFWMTDYKNPGRNRRAYSLAAVDTWLKDSDGETVTVNIVGPLTEYRRKVIYEYANSRGARRFLKPSALDPRTGIILDSTRVKSDSSGNAVVRYNKKSGVARLGVNKAINDTIAQRMRRHYRHLSFSYRFVRSKIPLRLYNSPKWRPDGQNINIPIIQIRLKRRSRRGRR